MYLTIDYLYVFKLHIKYSIKMNRIVLKCLQNKSHTYFHLSKYYFLLSIVCD